MEVLDKIMISATIGIKKSS